MKKTLFTVLLIVAIALSVTVISCSSEVKAKSSENYITFSTKDNSKFTLTIPYVFKNGTEAGSLWYSTDASTWTEVTATDTKEWNLTPISCTDLTAENGTLYLKGKNTTITRDGVKCREWRISATSGVTLSGNIMTLLNYNNPADKMTDDNQRCFNSMFKNCTSLTDISKLELKATTLATLCYAYMFNGCSSLTSTPTLPATKLANGCYSGMFYGTSIESAPELPATTLADECYLGMFSGCKSLQSAPELPAEILQSTCYQAMFYGCTSLKEAPELNATTLAPLCYNNMFNGCTNLKILENGTGTKIFECPSTLPDRAVKDMFTGTGGSFKGTPESGKTYYWY